MKEKKQKVKQRLSEKQQLLLGMTSMQNVHILVIFLKILILLIYNDF